MENKRNFKRKFDDKKPKKDFKPNSFKKVEKVEKAEETKTNIRYYIYKCLYNIYVNKAFKFNDVYYLL